MSEPVGLKLCHQGCIATQFLQTYIDFDFDFHLHVTTDLRASKLPYCLKLYCDS